MKTSQPHSDSAADEQAALWAARIDGDNLSSEQRADLDAWLTANPAHRTLLSRYCQISADLEEQIPALVAAGAVTLPASSQAPRRRWKWTFPRFASLTFAAAAAAAVTIVALRPTSHVESYSKASNQRGSHTLADGTRVELNANTSLRFENSDTERRARLASGEALFMVAKDRTRPFIVETPTGAVTVTGTTFNVRTEPAVTALEVTVMEGSVQVRPTEFNKTDSAPVGLVGGERLLARAGAVTKETLSAGDLEDALAWREGVIVFHGTSLAEALARYAHHHGRSLQVAPSVSELPVGGRYSIDDLTGFLNGLESTLPVKVTPTASGAWFVGPRSGS